MSPCLIPVRNRDQEILGAGRMELKADDKKRTELVMGGEFRGFQERMCVMDKEKGERRRRSHREEDPDLTVQ